MFSGSKSKPPSRIDTLIGAGTAVEGNVTFTGGLRIDGHVRGNVCAVDDKPGTLVLSEQARIEGEVRVSHIVVNGAIMGAVYAADYAELQSKANVIGDIHYRTLEMQHGAVVQGKFIYQADGKDDKVVQFKPVTVE